MDSEVYYWPPSRRGRCPRTPAPRRRALNTDSARPSADGPRLLRHYYAAMSGRDFSGFPMALHFRASVAKAFSGILAEQVLAASQSCCVTTTHRNLNFSQKTKNQNEIGTVFVWSGCLAKVDAGTLSQDTLGPSRNRLGSNMLPRRREDEGECFAPKLKYHLHWKSLRHLRLQKTSEVGCEALSFSLRSNLSSSGMLKLKSHSKHMKYL